MPIYTRTGDSGESSVKDRRVRKDAPVFAVLGDLDELSSWLGALKTLPVADTAALERAQRNLAAISADVAGYTAYDEGGATVALERDIDRLMPSERFSLRLPGGFVHVARAVCRRAERSLVAYSPTHAGLAYLNRLSDWLFALAESNSRSTSL